MSAIHAQLSPAYKLPLTKTYQERQLEKVFQENKNVHPSDLVILAAEVGLSPMEVKIWFEHRLACWRQSQGLPANGKNVYE